MPIELSEMTADHLDEVFALWQASEGVRMNRQSREEALRYLDRNPGLSLVALDAGRLVGAMLVGHDGYRGCLWHLAVAATHRRQGIGRQIVKAAFARLKAERIPRCHILVLPANTEAGEFWKALGFFDRPDIRLMTADL